MIIFTRKGEFYTELMYANIYKSTLEETHISNFQISELTDPSNMYFSLFPLEDLTFQHVF